MLRRAETQRKFAGYVMWQLTTGAFPWGVVSFDALMDVARRYGAGTDVPQTPSIVVNAAHCCASIALATRDKHLHIAVNISSQISRMN
jgi:hypothetical protein